MTTYSIAWLEKDTTSVPWNQVPSAAIDCFPWYQTGEQQQTIVRVAVSATHLHVRFECEDKHIFAQVTEPNGPVCEDSCVEFFLAPDPEKTLAYFNLEMNCCGTIHLAYGEDRYGRVMATPKVIDTIEVNSSVPGFTKQESPDDDGWTIEATVPFAALMQMASFPAPSPGNFWRGNFYRCGGKTDPQYACWSPIDWPQPDFHRPEYFGGLHIERLFQ
jgi:hypothetical protein